MMAQRFARRAGPKRWGRLHPLPRGDTAILPKIRGSTEKAFGWTRGIGLPVRFSRARESISGEAAMGEVWGMGSPMKVSFIRCVSWTKVTFDRRSGMDPPEVVGRAVSSTTGTGPPRNVGRTDSSTTGTARPEVVGRTVSPTTRTEPSGRKEVQGSCSR